MSWAVGYDETWHRDIGYGVPAIAFRRPWWSLRLGCCAVASYGSRPFRLPPLIGIDEHSSRCNSAAGGALTAWLDSKAERWDD